MSDRKVKIGIETTADTSGAQKTVDALDDVVDKGKDAGKALDDAGKGPGLKKLPSEAEAAAVSLDEVVDKGKDAGKALDDAGKGPGLKKLPSEAKAAAGSLDALEAEVKRLNLELNKLPVGSKQFVDLAGKAKEAKASLALAEAEAKKLGATVGRNGNAGGAVLEFSRAFEDAQYGMRGVLNNLPGLIAMLGGGAGLAGIISIAAVAGTQLWERLSDEKKADDSVKTIAKPLDLLKLLKTTLQDIAKAERERASEDTVEAFERQKNAIQSESLAVQGNNSLLKENLGYREKLAALESKEALRKIDKEERDGKLTSEQANKKRVGVAGASVENDLKFRQEAAALEVQALADKEAAEAKVTAAAQTNLIRARADLENRKKETEELQRQIRLRSELDASLAQLVPAQQKAYNSGVDAEKQSRRVGGIEAIGTEAIRKAVLVDLEKAAQLWNQIEDVRKRIAKEAPRAIQAYETTDKDGNKTTIDPNRKLDQLVNGSPDGKTESAATLSARLKTLEDAAKSAQQQQAGTAAARTNRENLASAQNANASDLASRNNPALQSAESIAAEATRKLSAEILAKIPVAAKGPESAGIEEKLRQILGDGQQKSEGGEVEILLQQLADFTGKNTNSSREFYSLIAANSESNNTLITEAIRLMKAFKSKQDEHARELTQIEQGAKGAPRGF